jgi:hypothetical protein
MGLMAQKLDASLALEGQFSAEGLAAMSADSGSLTMELAKSLVENIDFGDAERVWEKLGAEQPEPCVALVEDDDDDFFLWGKGAPGSLGSRHSHRGRSTRAVPKTAMLRQFNLFS